MTPYDVAVIKSSMECARYLKSLGGVSGTEAVSKLQSQKQQQTNGKTQLGNKQHTSSFENAEKTSKKPAKTTTGRFLNKNSNIKLEFIQFFFVCPKEPLATTTTTTTTTTTNTTTDESNNDEKKHVDYTQTEESESEDVNNNNNNNNNDEENHRRVSKHSMKSQRHSILNKRPITEQRLANKSNISESMERQKKRDAVLAAQMAQAQAERERQRKRQQQREQEDQARREERANQKMNNLQSVYTQAKSKSTASRGRLDEKSKKDSSENTNKSTINGKAQQQQQSKTNNNNGTFLPSLTNERLVNKLKIIFLFFSLC